MSSAGSVNSDFAAREFSPRVRLSIVMTHPIQYYAPWFHFITQQCRDIDLIVHYCVTPTPEQQGVGFDEAFKWDSSLLEGYDYEILRAPSSAMTIHSSSFFGVTVPEITTAIRRAKPDVAMVPGWYSVSLVMAAISARAAGIPVLYRGDSQLMTASGFPARARRVRTTALLKLFTGFLSVGKRNHSYLRSYGVPEKRISFSPPCVDNSFFSNAADSVDRTAERAALGISEQEFVVLFAGKLEPKKRPWEVIEAAGLMDSHPTVVIAGSGEMDHTCRRIAASTNAVTHFVGFMNQTEIARLYAVADCLVLPSDYGETWGMVVNEALAAGIPCVVSDRVGCSPDLIDDGQTGYVVPFADTAALAEALQKIRDALCRGHVFKAACRARAELYSLAAATRSLRSAIHTALGPAWSKDPI